MRPSSRWRRAAPDIGTLVVAKVPVAPDDHERHGNLFNYSTSVVEVWRRVQALRLITDQLHQESTCISQREKAVAVLGETALKEDDRLAQPAR